MCEVEDQYTGPLIEAMSAQQGCGCPAVSGELSGGWWDLGFFFFLLYIFFRAGGEGVRGADSFASVRGATRDSGMPGSIYSCSESHGAAAQQLRPWVWGCSALCARACMTGRLPEQQAGAQAGSHVSCSRQLGTLHRQLLQLGQEGLGILPGPTRCSMQGLLRLRSEDSLQPCVRVLCSSTHGCTPSRQHSCPLACKQYAKGDAPGSRIRAFASGLLLVPLEQKAGFGVQATSCTSICQVRQRQGQWG